MIHKLEVRLLVYSSLDLPILIQTAAYSPGSGGVVIVIVRVADFVSGGFSVAKVGESPTSSNPKIIATSEAKIKKRSFSITVQILPQKILDYPAATLYNNVS